MTWSLLIVILVALPAGETAEFRAEMNKKFPTEAACKAEIPTAALKFKEDFDSGDVPFLAHILKAAGKNTFEAEIVCVTEGMGT